MTNKRIPQLDALTGAGSANDDNLVIFDTSTDTTKRILRSQLGIGIVGDLPYTPSGSISATTIPTAIAELDTEKAALTGGNSFVGTQTIRAAATQDGVAISGRAGGTSSYEVTLTPTTLSADRIVTLPDAATTLPIISQVLTFSGPSTARTITLPDASITVARTDAAQTFTGTQTVRVAATQDSVALAGRAGGTSSYVATITPTTLTAARTITLPDADITVAGLGIAQTFTAVQTFQSGINISAANIVTDTTTGTRIATATNQKIGFFGVTPVIQQTELTDELTTITHTAPGTPDYAIQDLTQTTPFGFVTKDEGNTVLSVIANLQARVNELENKLVAYGLLPDAD